MTKNNFIEQDNFKNFKKLVVNIALSITLISCGFATTRLLMACSRDTTRSSESGSLGFVQFVNIYVNSPTFFLKQALSEANNSGLIFSVKKSQDGYDFMVEGLIANSPNHEGIKKVLGIGNTASGDVLFKIRLKSKNI
jgi:hypothetical protein